MPKLNNVDYFIQIGCQHMNMHYMDTKWIYYYDDDFINNWPSLFWQVPKNQATISRRRVLRKWMLTPGTSLHFFYKWMPTPVTRTLHNFHCHDHDCLQKSIDLITTTAFPLLRKRRSSKITVVRGVTRQSSFRNWQQGHLFSFALPSFSVILYLLAS